MSRPNVLIEDWLPFEAIGAESLRERGASSALPPLYFLHVWWARKPLAISRATILASLLPTWSSSWPEELHEHFPTEESYQRWFNQLLGIRGDPVAGRKLIQLSKETGIALQGNPYGAPRAFTVKPQAEDLQLMNDILAYTWGTREVSVMDVTAGGGSIPFEALRYGFTTYANEINPVASVILKATLEYPASFSKSLADDIRKWGAIWSERVSDRLEMYFPKQLEENIFAYLWARTVTCPYTGKPVPLSPNWWLDKEGDGIAAHVVVKDDWQFPRFAIGVPGSHVFVEGIGETITIGDPNRGTISRGVAISPWTNEAIDGDYIKSEAQAGRMGQMLYAVVVKRRGGFDFRPPTSEDLNAIANAETEVKAKIPLWGAKGLLPDEQIDISNYDRGHRLYGIYHWYEFFAPRQLLSMVTFLETLKALSSEIRDQVDNPAIADALETYLAIALDKAVIYNAQQSRFDSGRGIRSIFDKHNYAFVWSHAEFDASNNLLPWVIDQIVDSYSEISDLVSSTQYPLWDGGHQPIERLHISKGSAADLEAVMHFCDGKC